MSAGRPSLLTPDVHARIVRGIAAGNYRETAARAAGVSDRTLRRWCEQGESGEEPHASFLADVERAEARAEMRLLRQIRRAQPAVTGEGGRGADLWTAKAWMMERRWPKRWGGRVRATVAEELGALMDKLQRALDAETFRKVVDATREDAPAAAPEPRH